MPTTCTSPPFVIGITGGIGSGKSLVAELFANHGGRLVVADVLGHEALRRPEVRRQVVERWGAGVLAESGEIDRRKLGAIVFSDNDERRALEAISHPWIIQQMREQITQAQQDPRIRFVVLDAALLFEAGWDAVCDRVVFIDTAQEIRQQRVFQKRGWCAEELSRRESAQLALTQKRSSADHVLNNSSTVDHLDQQVRELLARWGYDASEQREGCLSAGKDS